MVRRKVYACASVRACVCVCVGVHRCERERERERGRGSLIAFVGVLLVEKNYSDINKWLSSQSDSLFVVQRSGKLQITCSDYA